MFANCFTPKPARTGATAQLSLVDHKSQKAVDGHNTNMDIHPSGIPAKALSAMSGGQDLVRKLNESSEKR